MGNVEDDPYIDLALKEIARTYGMRCSVSSKAKTLIKFGRNPALGTTEQTIWQNNSVNHEVMLTASDGNLITHIVSDDATDTGQSIYLEGHYWNSEGQLTFISQTVTSNGQTKVALPTAMCRCTRMRDLSLIGAGVIGNVYALQDISAPAGVPSDFTKVHNLIAAGFHQSQKAATTVSYSDVWILTAVWIGCTKKTAAYVDANLELSVEGKEWAEQFPLSTSADAGMEEVKGPPYFIVPASTDIRIAASAASTPVFGAMAGYLAQIIAR